jgi:cholesterol transport system auxiliary component
MNRRALLLTFLLAGCGLATRPYAERRQWPLAIVRPGTLAPAGRKVLEVRTLRAGPGLEARGLQSLQADGSIRTGFYEEWSVPPAQGVEEALRSWLAASGLFAAVVAPGSRVTADYILEGDLDALWTAPARKQADAALAITLITNGTAPRVLLQRRFEATAALSGSDAGADSAAMLAALAIVLARVEVELRRAIG